MTDLALVNEHYWSLSSIIGSEHPFFRINPEPVIYTWIMLAILATALVCIRLFVLRKPDEKSIGHFIVVQFVSNFMNMITQSLGAFSFGHFCFITTLFVFILLCNILTIFPWLDEPTKDLNTTLALGIISFIYIQATAIRQHGIIAYLKEYLTPFFAMLPLHVVGKLASIISISFRLFGNIFGGSIITTIYFGALKGSALRETLGIMMGMNLLITLFFSLFEGFLQAFVFCMLSLTYLSIAVQGENH